MLAPRYQEWQVTANVPPATSLTCATQVSWASSVASIETGLWLDHILDAVRNPLDVLLNGHHHIGQHRRTARSRDGKEVGETGDSQP